MKRLTAAALFAAFLMVSGCAGAQNKTYVFPYEGLRYTERDGETVLTRTNLDASAELLASLGTTADAMLSDFEASGTVMEILPDEGGQITVSVASAGETKDTKALAEQMQSSGLYEACELQSGDPETVRTVSSAMAGSMEVYTLRYSLIHMNRLYLFTKTIVGRAPEASDDAELTDLIAAVTLLDVIPEATATPTPAPTATPVPTPAPTPGVAETIEQTGTMTVSEMPAYVTSDQLTVSGMTDAGKTVRVTADGVNLGQTVASSSGSFSLTVTLPNTGEMVIGVLTDSAEAMFRVEYEYPKARLKVTEPANTTFTGSGVVVRGITEPEATIYVNGKGNNTNVKANRNGEFNIRIAMNRAGTETFTIRAHLKGCEDNTTSITLTRAMTEREQVQAFRTEMVAVSYDALNADPASYTGKKFTMRCRVIDFSDYNGTPCALACVSNPSTGVWRDPLWIVLTDAEGIAAGESYNFYLTGEGITLPTDGTYTRSGQPEEVPVVRQVTFR